MEPEGGRKAVPTFSKFWVIMTICLMLANVVGMWIHAIDLSDPTAGQHLYRHNATRLLFLQSFMVFDWLAAAVVAYVFVQRLLGKRSRSSLLVLWNITALSVFCGFAVVFSYLQATFPVNVWRL